MAEPLKDQFGPDVAERIGAALDRAATDLGVTFDRDHFVDAALDGFDDLELGARAQLIADAMAASLPADRAIAIEVVHASLGPELDVDDDSGMGAFVYWPLVKFVADHGHDHLEAALQLQYELTKRFTAEFSIRTYLQGPHQAATLERLRRWTGDESEHVRRLVSEGTRPRLPWAPRLRQFVDDPTPVLELLELLRHDSSEYVRRSVANNLNDIAKDHPDVVVSTCRRWWSDADGVAGEDERRMIRHALRTLVKAGHLGALDVLGYGPSSPAQVTGGRIEPDRVAIGGAVRVHVDVANPTDAACRALVDVRVHFVKANGTTSAKVFKGAELELAPGTSTTVTKNVSLRQHTTRTHYPGVHRVDALVNGVAVGIGTFELLPS